MFACEDGRVVVIVSNREAKRIQVRKSVGEALGESYQADILAVLALGVATGRFAHRIRVHTVDVSQSSRHVEVVAHATCASAR